MPLQIKNGNQEKIAQWSMRHNMSQNEIVNLIISVVSDVVLEEIIVEAKVDKVRPRVLKVKRVATWGV